MKHAYVVTQPIEGLGFVPNIRDHDQSVYLKLQVQIHPSHGRAGRGCVGEANVCVRACDDTPHLTTQGSCLAIGGYEQDPEFWVSGCRWVGRLM